MISMALFVGYEIWHGITKKGLPPNQDRVCLLVCAELTVEASLMARLFS